MSGRPPTVAGTGAGALVAVAVLFGVLGGAAPVGAQRAELYRPPVDAPVMDPFRPPDQPWLAGNRGLEYDTGPGTLVQAIGSGLVVFAGPVAGQLYVTVLHGDGIRSSYSYLAATSVREGERVRGGQIIGVTGDVPFHLGARVGDVYIDPAALFGSPVGVASVFLVPLGGGAGSDRSPPRRVDATGVPPPVGEGTGALVAATGRRVAGGAATALGVAGR